MKDYKSLQDAARANAQLLSKRLPAAHEDQAWLTDIHFRKDGNVRLTRNRFEEWMGEAFLEGFKHQRRLRGETSLLLLALSKPARLASLVAAGLLSVGLGLIAMALGFAPVLVGSGALLVAVALLIFTKRI